MNTPRDHYTLTNGAHVLRFDSFSEYRDAAVELPSLVPGPHSRIGGRDEWAGGSWADAVRLATEGDSAALAGIDAVAASVAHKVRAAVVEAPVSYMDVSGGEVDVAAWLSGEPECMREYVMAPVPTRGRVVRVLVAGGGTREVKPEWIRKRGAAVLALLRAVSAANLTLDVWWEHATEHHGTPGSLSRLVHLVHASEEPDWPMLGFALTSPAMHRRLSFAVLESHAIGRRFGAGRSYGHPVRPKMAEHIAADVVVPIPTGHTAAETDAEAWVRSVMESAGVEFNNNN